MRMRGRGPVLSGTSSPAHCWEVSSRSGKALAARLASRFQVRSFPVDGSHLFFQPRGELGAVGELYIWLYLEIFLPVMFMQRCRNWQITMPRNLGRFCRGWSLFFRGSLLSFFWEVPEFLPSEVLNLLPVLSPFSELGRDGERGGALGSSQKCLVRFQTFPAPPRLHSKMSFKPRRVQRC